MISSCWPSCICHWQNVVWTAEVPGLWDFKSTLHMRDLGRRKRITFSNIWKEDCRIGSTHQVRYEYEEQGCRVLKKQCKYKQLCQMWLCRHKRLGFKQKSCFMPIFAYGETYPMEVRSRTTCFKFRNKQGLWGTAKASSSSCLSESFWFLELSKYDF